MQTHNFENLLSVETSAIKLLRAAKDTPATITQLKESLPEIEHVSDLVKQLAFLEVGQDNESLKSTTNQIFSDSSDTSTCFVLLTPPKEEGVSAED